MLETWMVFNISMAGRLPFFAVASVQVRDVGEAFLAEEPLVEGVVEVLDRAVAPRLPGGDEHRRGVLAQAHAYDLAQPGRGAERAAVVELDPLGHAVAAAPQRGQRQH